MVPLHLMSNNETVSLLVGCMGAKVALAATLTPAALLIFNLVAFFFFLFSILLKNHSLTKNRTKTIKNNNPDNMNYQERLSCIPGGIYGCSPFSQMLFQKMASLGGGGGGGCSECLNIARPITR
jgi:hypothetical protein